jgi:K+-sensing histidine kinase KdpD
MNGFLKFQADIILKDIAKEERLNPNFNTALVRFFFTRVDVSGKIIGYSSDITVPEQDVQELKEEVLKKGVNEGKIANNKYKFKFLKVTKAYGYIIVFLDYGVEEMMLKPLVFIGTFVGLVSLALVFGISLFLANKAVRPIKTSWEKQAVFIADASHELRTPLAVVNSNLEIVMENEDETVGSQSKWLGNVKANWTA